MSYKNRKKKTHRDYKLAWVEREAIELPRYEMDICSI